MRSPWLTVIIPTFNGQRFLAETLEAVSGEDTSDLEVIAVDDGSTDETLEILRRFEKRLPLEIISENHAGNWIRNTNLGLRRARGRYVSFLHQDDYWIPGRLDKMRELAAEFPDAVALLHDSQFIDSNGAKLGTWRCPFGRRKKLLSPELVFSRLIVQNFIAIPAPIWKREAMSPETTLDESLWFTADWKLWLSLSRLGTWAYLPDTLACFRIHSEAQTLTGVKNESSYREQYERVLEEFLPLLTDDRQLGKVARFSSDINQMLAALFHRRTAPVAKLLFQGLNLGPVGWYRYFRYSRIGERVMARLRVKLRRPAGA